LARAFDFPIHNNSIVDTSPEAGHIKTIANSAAPNSLDRQAIVSLSEALPFYLSDNLVQHAPLEYLAMPEKLTKLGLLVKDFVHDNPDCTSSSFPQLATVVQLLRDDLTERMNQEKAMAARLDPVVRPMFERWAEQIGSAIPESLS